LEQALVLTGSFFFANRLAGFGLSSKLMFWADLKMLLWLTYYVVPVIAGVVVQTLINNTLETTEEILHILVSCRCFLSTMSG
jgi:hypothetical protein